MLRPLSKSLKSSQPLAVIKLDSPRVHHHNQSSPALPPLCQSLKFSPCLQLPSFLTSGISALFSLISSQQSSMKPTPTDLLFYLLLLPCFSTYFHPLCFSGRPASSHLSYQEHNFPDAFGLLWVLQRCRGTCQLWQFWVWAAPFVPPNLSSHSSYKYLSLYLNLS